MRKNTIKYLSLIVVSILFTAPFAIMAAASANGDNEQHRDVSLNDRGGAFDDTWIPVSTPQELAWVGDNNTRTASNGISYTWSADGKYYLANDIAFDDGPGHDTNGGSDMTVSATASGTDINITVTPPSGAAVTYLSAWIGASDNTSLNNTVQLTDVPGGTHIVMIGGTMTLDTVKHNFAHSFEMDTTSGTSMNDIKFNSNGNFDPIGTIYPFKGRFDGNGRLISGINVAVFSDGASDVYAGLFGRIENAEISNIGIVNGSVMTSTSSQYQSSCVGVIAGHAELSTVSNCHSSAIVTVSSSSYDLLYAGGIVGHALSSSITKCSNSGNVTVASYSSHAGGIAGYASSSLLTNCRNAGNIKISAVNDLHAGGIAGYASSPVTNCYNTGSVTVSSSSDLSYAGGIAGHTTSSITDCYNAGTITLLSSYSYAGGIAGQASRASVINCYNIGRVSGSETASYAGGIIGMAYRTPTVLNCHYLAGTLFIGGSLHEDRLCGAGTPIIDGSSNDPARKTDPDQESGEKTESQMRPGLAEAQAAGGGNSIYYTGTSTIASAPVQGWDFVSIWTISPDTNEGYPMLRSFSSMTVRFTEQPKDVKAAAGEKVTLSVLAESFMLPRYQWYVSADNGTTWDEIDGANGTSHTLYTTKSDNGKMFRVSATAPDHEGTTSHSDAATLRVDSYEVSLISGEGYTISPYGGSSSPIDRGGSFTFQFRVNEGYAGTYTVFVNNSEVKLDTNGTYTIANITGDKTVTAQVTLTRVYDVTLTSDNGYTLSPYGGSLSPVERGGSFTFSFTVDEGFTAVSYKVFVNTVEVSLNADGTYTIEDITTAQKVTVEGTFTWNVYDVTLTSGSGYTLIGYGGSSSPVDHGDPFTFQFRMNEGYAGTYKVFVNDAEITLDADGTYTIENITSAQTVTVEGEFEMILGAGKGDPRIGIFIILVGTAVILALYAFIIIRGKERRAKEQ